MSWGLFWDPGDLVWPVRPDPPGWIVVRGSPPMPRSLFQLHHDRLRLVSADVPPQAFVGPDARAVQTLLRGSASSHWYLALCWMKT